MAAQLSRPVFHLQPHGQPAILIGQRAAIQAAILGLGLIRCMSYEAHHELQSGLLEPVLSDFASPALPAQLIYRDGRRAEARVRTFIDFATPRLRAHPAFLGA